MRYFSILLLFSVMSVQAQTDGIKKYPEGNVNYSVLFNSKNKGDFEPEFLRYQPDAESIKFIKSQRKNVRMKIVMGFWCDDSKIYVPRMLKILKDANWDVEEDQVVKIYGVDENKNAGFDGFQSMNIQFVPTFIVYYDNNEVGRIVESPKVTLEKDLVEILKKNIR